MKLSDDLFQLIHSLNQGEKRHFKVYTSRHAKQGQKNYIRLFNAIDRQEEYDETAIRKKFARETFIKQLAVTKTYLYKLILESLEVHNTDNHTDRKVERILHHVQILYGKRLYKPAYKLLKKGRKIASDRDMHLLNMKLLHWERLLSYEMLPTNRWEKEQEKLHTEETQALEAHKTAIDYGRLATKLTSLMFQPENKPNHIKKYMAIFDHPLMQEETRPKTVYAQCYYHILKAYHYNLSGDLQGACNCFRTGLDLMEQYPNKLAEHKTSFLVRYLACSYNYLMLLLDQGHFDKEAEKRLENMRELPIKIMGSQNLPPNIANRVFVNYNAVQMRHYLITAQFDKGFRLAKEIEKSLEGTTPAVNTTLVTEPFMMTGLFFFCAGRFDEALKWFNHLMNKPQLEEFPASYAWVRLLVIIQHFELKHEALLEHHIKSTYRYLAKRTRLYESEKFLLHFFRKEAPRIHDQRSLRKAFRELYEELSKFGWDTHEGKAISQLQLLPWLQSHIEGRPLPIIIRERNQGVLVK